MYYIDSYSKQLVEDKDISPYAPPERYIEYREGFLDGVVKETYIVSYNPLRLIDFSYLTYLIPDNRNMISMQRRVFFESNNIPSNSILFAYTVPSEWYKEETKKLEKECHV